MAAPPFPSAPPSAAGHARATLALGLPLIGSHLAQFALHVTDTVMLGWYGVLPLAAGVLGASSFFIVFVLGSGFAHAVMPKVAAALGRGDTRMAMWLSAAFGIGIYPLFWWSEAILLALGQDAEVSRLAAEYMRIAGLGLAPALIVMALKNALAALMRTQVVLWVTVAAAGLNAALNWALIFGNWGAPEMGVAGSAVATVGVQLFSLALLVGYAALARGLRQYAFFVRMWRPDWPALVQVFRLGWPIGLTGLAEGGLFQASAIMMGWIGPVELAAHGIALEVASLSFMIHVGLSNAATVRAGLALGAGDAAALRQGARVAIVLSLGVAGLAVAAMLAFPQAIIGLFLNAADPAAPRIVAFGTTLLAIAALFQLADAMQVMALGLLRGLQDTRVPMWIAAFGYWCVGIPTSYVLAFPLGLGGAGLWLGLVVGLSLVAVLLMRRFWTRAPG